MKFYPQNLFKSIFNVPINSSASALATSFTTKIRSVEFELIYLFKKIKNKNI